MLCRVECTCGRYGTLINDAKFLLQQVHRWKVSHVKCTANEATHIHAKLALSRSEERLWIEDYPFCVRDIVIDEATSD
jgi:hypothetical protein